MTADEPLRLNIGCGSNVVPGWVNCDLSFARLRFRLGRLLGLPRYQSYRGLRCEGIDAKRPLPFPSNSVEAIYEQHMLYAFDLDQTRAFFAECYRVLRSDGVLRVNEDDLRTVAERYLQGDSALVEYVNSAGTVRVSGVRAPADAVSAIFKRWRSLAWLHDAQSLASHMAAVGFASIEPKGFRESRLPDIELLEKDNRDSILGQVWLEAVKP